MKFKYKIKFRGFHAVVDISENLLHYLLLKDLY